MRLRILYASSCVVVLFSLTADDLRINLVVKHDDPRKGSVTLTVTQVALHEPDAALFEIPQNYKRAGAEPESR
jgi:hypothetical protein